MAYHSDDCRTIRLAEVSELIVKPQGTAEIVAEHRSAEEGLLDAIRAALLVLRQGDRQSKAAARRLHRAVTAYDPGFPGDRHL